MPRILSISSSNLISSISVEVTSKSTIMSISCPAPLGEQDIGLGITRSRYYEVLSKKSGQKGEGKQINKTKVGKFDQTNRMLVQRIKAIKGKHPFWGYRRVRAWLRYREGIKVNQKRIYKLMKENGF